MKFENFTNYLKATLGTFSRISILPAMLLLLTYGTANAQCTLGCNNNVQISLDDDCEVEVTYSMILEGEGPASCGYSVAVLGSNDLPIPSSPIVGRSYIGQTLKVRISIPDGNSCWGYISIEDKLAPVIVCPDDITISCYDASVATLPVVNENCGDYTLNELSDVTTDLDCNDNFSAVRVITYQAVDLSGNESNICSQSIYFDRIGLGDITFPENYDDIERDALSCTGLVWDVNGNDYPDVEETGAPTTPNGAPIFPNNSLCELNATYEDQVLQICQSSYKVLRKWTVLDWCTSNVEDEFQIIKVLDNRGPLATCPQDGMEISADPYDCTGDFIVPDPTVSFDCSDWEYTVAYLLADNTGGAPSNGLYITDNVVTMASGQIVVRDLPLGRTWIKYIITDKCGNVSECFTEVDVVDDVPPVAVCDQFTVVTLTNSGIALAKALTFDDGSYDNCSEVTFDARRMTNACGSGTFAYTEYVEFCCADVGNEVMVELRVRDTNGNTNTCMVSVTVQDKINPVIVCPDDITLDCGQDFTDLSITGSAEAFDNCGVNSPVPSDRGSLDQCGVGIIYRDWTAGNASCTQTITVVDPDPFTGSDINWPSDEELTGCMNSDTDVSDTGEPTFNDDACSLVAYTYKDQTFEFVDGACFKILRTFTVIDWCTFDQNTPQGGGIWQRTQIIKLNNTINPTINSCNDITECVFGADCSGEVELILDASDDCTPTTELVYSYSLDLDNDGSIDATGNTNNATRVLDVGTHRISWRVEDRCGNQETCSQLITVRDCKKPTPYCRSEITTVLMPSTGQVTIWASDFDLGSEDNCPGDVKISFSQNTNDINATFTCDQLGLQDLEMWVTDNASPPNQDFCAVRINIQSNEGCDGSSPAISGNVGTESNTMVPDVMVRLENSSSQEMEYFETQDNGSFAFANFTAPYYQLTADRNDFHGNGVSTLDLVLIQRHILGINNLDSPLKVIAADINNNEAITGADIVQLRKLILGIYNEFPENRSWKFIDAGQTFSDASLPWPVKESIDLVNDNTSKAHQDFKAIKIGDVNGSTTVGARPSEDVVENRSANEMNFIFTDNTFQAGDRVSIAVTADQISNILGYQFTLDFNSEELSFEGVDAGIHNVTGSNVNATQASSGKVAVSYDNALMTSTSDAEAMFYLTFVAKTNGSTAQSVSFNNELTKAEIYAEDLTVMNLNLSSRSATEAPMILLQNTPNPFSTETDIRFVLNEAAQATISVFDITGKTLKVITNEYAKGVNKVTLNANDLAAQGILYYQIESNGYKATKKMIVINN